MSSLKNQGYNALDSGVVNLMPVVMTEWGHSQTTTDYATVYSTCLKSYLSSIKGGWMVWVLSGSYYTREGIQDSDESWGEFILGSRLVLGSLGDEEKRDRVEGEIDRRLLMMIYRITHARLVRVERSHRYIECFGTDGQRDEDILAIVVS